MAAPATPEFATGEPKFVDQALGPVYDMAHVNAARWLMENYRPRPADADGKASDLNKNLWFNLARSCKPVVVLEGRLISTLGPKEWDDFKARQEARKAGGRVEDPTDEELQSKYCGKQVTFTIAAERGDGEDHERDLAAARSFFGGLADLTVGFMAEHWADLFRKTPLLRPKNRTPEDEREETLGRLQEIYDEKKPCVFGDDGGYRVRLRATVPEMSAIRNPGWAPRFNEVAIFKPGPEPDSFVPAGPEVLRFGARVAALFTSGSLWVSPARQFGHHLRLLQLVVIPAGASERGPARCFMQTGPPRSLPPAGAAAGADASADRAEAKESSGQKRRLEEDDHAPRAEEPFA